jgi:hypothetical protein
MFGGCSKLNYIKVEFTDWGDITNESTAGCVSDVEETGTFVCPAELDVKQRGTRYIPEKW